MAIGRGEKRTFAQFAAEDEAYLSDESDFYGDRETQSELEHQASTFSVSKWCRDHVPSVTELALSNLAAAQSFHGVKLYNYYEGVQHASSCRQLGETVDEFLSRLPPATTPTSQVSWIRIANPYESWGKLSGDEEGEAPWEEESDWPAFVRQGTEMLQELTKLQNDIEKGNSLIGKVTVRKLATKAKDEVVKNMLEMAVRLHCSSGKWMVFCSTADVNAIWSVVAKAVAKNELGTSAKVAPFSGNNGEPRVICIYTRDFTDMKEISRVLHKLRDLGIVERTGKPIYYKCDAYTYLGLKSNNEWGIQASLYKSNDIFQAENSKSKETKKIDGYFYKPKIKETGKL